jgi:NTP pyrophosphatase (non-canonical NTP hydrolase)
MGTPTIVGITERIQKIDAYFRETNTSMSERERIFSRLIKLQEEVGELAEAVLYENDTNQRKKEKTIDLDSELADVMISTLVLAYGRERDVWTEIDKKLTKQFERFRLQ